MPTLGALSWVHTACHSKLSNVKWACGSYAVVIGYERRRRQSAVQWYQEHVQTTATATDWWEVLPLAWLLNFWPLCSVDVWLIEHLNSVQVGNHTAIHTQPVETNMFFVREPDFTVIRACIMFRESFCYQILYKGNLIIMIPVSNR